MIENIKPIDDRIIVEIIKEEEQKVSDLILMEATKKELKKSDFQKGKVVAVGDGTKDVTMKVKIGDIVLLKEEQGDNFRYEGKNYMIFRQSYLFCIL